MSTQTSDPNRPDYIIGAAAGMAHDAKLVRDVARGTSHLRSQSTSYLPKHASEEGSDYNRRLEMAVLSVNAIERTVTGLAGMVFRKDPTLGEDVPEVMRLHTENVDYAGTHLDVFTRSLFEDGLEAGHAGILVDAPSVQALDGRTLTDAEESVLGVRPYWIPIRKEQIIGWRTITTTAGPRWNSLRFTSRRRSWTVRSVRRRWTGTACTDVRVAESRSRCGRHASKVPPRRFSAGRSW